MFLAFLIAPGISDRRHRHADHRSAAGLERTREVLRERPEDQDPRRQVNAGRIQGEVIFDHVTFAYDEGKTVLHD